MLCSLDVSAVLQFYLGKVSFDPKMDQLVCSHSNDN